MRIGVVTTSYPRSPGDAAGGFVAKLSQWMTSGGHALEVVAAGSGHEDDAWHDLPVTRVCASLGLFYQGGAPDALASRLHRWHALAFSTRLLREVRRQAANWDGMVAHWLAPSALACVLAAGNKPIWAIAHGGDVHLLAKLGLTKVAARLLNRPNLHLNFVSRSVRDVFAKHAGHHADELMARSTVCSMGIDVPHFQELRDRWQAQDDQARRKPTVLFLGRLVRIKGADILLEALGGIDSDCRVVMAGSGPEQDALKEQARTYGLDVEWRGEVRSEERDQLLAAADIVVMPSREHGGRQEGMPLVALEALASGAQLLVSQSGGLAEIPESICHRVPSEDPLALRAKLSGLLGGDRAAFAPGHWLQSHDWKALGPQLLPGLSHTHSACRTA